MRPDRLGHAVPPDHRLDRGTSSVQRLGYRQRKLDANPIRFDLGMKLGECGDGSVLEWWVATSSQPALWQIIVTAGRILTFWLCVIVVYCRTTKAFSHGLNPSQLHGYCAELTPTGRMPLAAKDAIAGRAQESSG
jgi:hypothetical protein